MMKTILPVIAAAFGLLLLGQHSNHSPSTQCS